MNIDGTDPQRVTNHPDDDFASSWTDDGTRLVFDTERNGQWDIYVIGLDGTNPERLTTSSSDDRFPKWRP